MAAWSGQPGSEWDRVVHVSKKAFEQQLGEIEALAAAAPEAAEAGLRKALGHRNNFIVAKAAGVTARMGLRVLVPELVAAAARFFEQPAKSDPQCWAKNAIVQALSDLGFAEPEVYLRGLRHVQMEPVYGGSQDSAGPLRAQSANALAACTAMPDIEVLRQVLALLVDPEREVRIAAAEIIGRVGRPEAALLLRLKSLAGDADPEVLGASLAALLSIEGAAGVDFVAGLLERPAEIAAEAVFALGLSRERRAFDILVERYRKRGPGEPVAYVWFSAIALTRLEEAAAFLLDVIGQGEPDAPAAMEALAATRPSDEVRLRLAAVMEQCGDERLRRSFRRHFPR